MKFYGRKSSPSKKTKIAAQWINLLAAIGIAGILGIGLILPLFYKEGFKRVFEKISPEKYFSGIIFGLCYFSFLFWSSLQLIRGKKWAWWLWVVHLSILFLIDVVWRKFSFDSLFILIPLILLLLDRKNFWEVDR